MVTLGEVYKSSQLVIVSLRVCSGPQQTRSFYRVSDRAEISTRRTRHNCLTPYFAILPMNTPISRLSSEWHIAVLTTEPRSAVESADWLGSGTLLKASKLVSRGAN